VGVLLFKYAHDLEDVLEKKRSGGETYAFRHKSILKPTSTHTHNIRMDRDSIRLYLQRQLSDAKTHKDLDRFKHAIHATQLAVNPRDTEHTADNVEDMMSYLTYSQHGDRYDMNYLIGFLEKRRMTEEDCKRTAQLLIETRGFKVPTPMSERALECLQRAELEKFKADEALEAAKIKAKLADKDLTAILNGIRKKGGDI
jgi:hypothetical protein